MTILYIARQYAVWSWTPFSSIEFYSNAQWLGSHYLKIAKYCGNAISIAGIDRHWNIVFCQQWNLWIEIWFGLTFNKIGTSREQSQPKSSIKNKINSTSTEAENTGSYERTAEKIFIKLKKSQLKMVGSGVTSSLVEVHPILVSGITWPS